LSLRIGGSHPRSKPVQRLAQRQQIGRAEGCFACSHHAELIPWVDVGERACDRAKSPIWTCIDHAVFAPMAAPADHLEGAAVQRVKRVRDPHLEAGRTNTACS
jgi:hypothetical protein